MFKNALNAIVNFAGIPLLGVIAAILWVVIVSNLIWYVGDYDADELVGITSWVFIISLAVSVLWVLGVSNEDPEVAARKALEARVAAAQKLADDMRKLAKRRTRRAIFARDGIRIGRANHLMSPEDFAARDWYELDLIRSITEEQQTISLLTLSDWLTKALK